MGTDTGCIETVIVRFLSLLLLLLPFAANGDLSLPPPMEDSPQYQLNLSEAEAREIGKRIWHNEGAGKVENLVVWNRGEDFPSLGIGHFIWYPPGIEGPFVESFPALRDQLVKEVRVPQWLLETDDAPWMNRDAFHSEINSWRMQELRELMRTTMPQQVGFIIHRLEEALPAMVMTLDSDTERAHVEQQFYRVANSSDGVYALIDYVNFKGEGISLKERYRGEGWGLLQVLQTMRAERRDVMAEFVRVADLVLTRRVQNAPRDERRWLSGWRKRINSYR